MKKIHHIISVGILLCAVVVFGESDAIAQAVPEPITYSTTYSYDALGRLTGATTDRQLTTVYTYDAVGKLTSLEQTAFSGVFVEPEDNTLPGALALHPAYPNPFNPQTTIQFDLPSSSRVQLEVFDSLGRRVRVLQQGLVEAGHHHVVLHGASLSSGVYLVVLNAENQRFVQMLTLLK